MAVFFSLLACAICLLLFSLAIDDIDALLGSIVLALTSIYVWFRERKPKKVQTSTEPRHATLPLPAFPPLDYFLTPPKKMAKQAFSQGGNMLDQLIDELKVGDMVEVLDIPADEAMAWFYNTPRKQAGQIGTIFCADTTTGKSVDQTREYVNVPRRGVRFADGTINYYQTIWLKKVEELKAGDKVYVVTDKPKEGWCEAWNNLLGKIGTIVASHPDKSCEVGFLAGNSGGIMISHLRKVPEFKEGDQVKVTDTVPANKRLPDGDWPNDMATGKVGVVHSESDEAGWLEVDVQGGIFYFHPSWLTRVEDAASSLETPMKEDNMDKLIKKCLNLAQRTNYEARQVRLSFRIVNDECCVCVAVVSEESNIQFYEARAGDKSDLDSYGDTYEKALCNLHQILVDILSKRVVEDQEALKEV